MTRWIGLGALALLVTGCTVGGGTRTEMVSVTQVDGRITRTVTTSTGETVTPSIRFGMAPTAGFYTAAPDELCAIAKAALIYERDRGAAAPVEGLFYDNGVAIGPDCTGAYASIGLQLGAPGNGETRRVSMPRQVAEGGVAIGVDYGCTDVCLGGATYRLYRRHDEWQVDPRGTITWMR